MHPIIAQSTESLEEAGEANQQEAGIFITNEESFADLTPLRPKLQDHKQSTPLPELTKKAKGFQNLRGRGKKKTSLEYNTRDIVIADHSV